MTISLDDISLELEAHKCRSSLYYFIKKAWHTVEKTGDFSFKDNWHIQVLCQHLELVARGKINRLMINIPPRCMKSLNVSVFWPAWLWCQKDTPTHDLMGPTCRIITISYGKELATRDNERMRSVLRSDWYKKTFKDTVSFSKKQDQKTYFKNTKGGERWATSPDSTLTGLGGDLIILDDIHNVKEAESKSEREKVITWWRESLQSRLNRSDSPIVVVMHRVHHNDLCGYINETKDKQFNLTWTKLSIPAQYEGKKILTKFAKDPRTKISESIWPSRFGKDDFLRLKSSIGTYAYHGQYQQRPTPRDGGMIKNSWFKSVDNIPTNENEIMRMRCWDLAGSEDAKADRTACVLMALTNKNHYYILDAYTMRGEWHKVETAIYSHASKDSPSTKILLPEDPGQAGKMQFAYIKSKLPSLPILKHKELKNKRFRAETFAAKMEAGQVYLIKGDWNKDYKDELTSFPSGRHDDLVDCTTAAFNKMEMLNSKESSFVSFAMPLQI